MRALRVPAASLIFGIISVLTSVPLEAAEVILINYGPVQLQLKTSSLEAFALNGTIDANLRTYLKGTTPSQQAEFRRALVEKANINPLQISRFFNTETGEEILTFFGEYIKIQGGINGKLALRGAIIQASLDPQGLTLLNFLQKLPTNVEINVNDVLKLSRMINLVVQATESFSQNLAQLSAEEAAKNPLVNYASMTDLRQAGTYDVIKERWTLTDPKRQRTFYMDVYKPRRWRSGQTPVMIFSHGLASRPEDFEKQLSHLASYGYFVAAPQHPGSDFNQVKNLLDGYSNQVFNRNEFIDRPLDISFIIDELERRNPSEFNGRLNLKSVGVMGHSFGGYTALALAGATIDFDYLEDACNDDNQYFNLSLLLQCRALKLPRQEYNFRDPRVQAVLAANPVNSSLFGPKGLAKIQIPVWIGAGSYDPATPFVFEQARSFPWLTTENKYLGMMQGQAHVDFSALDAGLTTLIDSSNILLPSPNLISAYGDSTMVAFFEVYIANNEDYRPFLRASYSAYLSQDQPFKFYVITEASSEELKTELKKYRSEHGY
ncbi:alpha/beta hydrolase [Chroococcus sp. FPU101]|uniref:alpha/beta hydrolase n=1 Tax=Chroococcus sp. FPU101 TaxID=1974212 RepID=UPI001A8D7639|nr:alpha/beta hydrolase [Chroococcus sp. FPU101]